MGIEPERTVPQSLHNRAFRDSKSTACDWRAKFRIARGNVGLRETTRPFAIEFPLLQSTRKANFANDGILSFRDWAGGKLAVKCGCALVNAVGGRVL